ncbi:hypothetical protein [Methylobacterium sp. SI9]|uniref:hypothetical protein n=1 Tax=Methylobacterium guangdongense TaxID=3138811 RepID=UPI00313EB4F1
MYQVVYYKLNKHVNRLSMLIGIVFVSMSLLPSVAEDFADYPSYCKTKFSSGSERRECINSKIIKDASSIKEKTGIDCNTKRCVLKMSPNNEIWGHWEAKGYTLVFKSGQKAEEMLGQDTGLTAVIITDPEKRISLFSTCLTCLDFTYISGPIKKANSVFLSRQSEILIFSKQ